MWVERYPALHTLQPAITDHKAQWKQVQERSDNVYASCTKYFMFMLALFLLNNFITIMVVMKI